MEAIGVASILELRCRTRGYDKAIGQTVFENDREVLVPVHDHVDSALGGPEKAVCLMLVEPGKPVLDHGAEEETEIYSTEAV